MLMESSGRTSPLIKLESVTRSYPAGKSEISALKAVDLTIDRGEACVLLGASGSGKSTLLNILGLLDLPSSGRFFLNGKEMGKACSDERASLRNREIGFIFQSFNLLPRLNALDNVALPLAYRGIGKSEARDQAMAQLDRVGLTDRAEHVPADLSGGQRQRVAIARALVGHPSLVLADEPTGNLDADAAHSVLKLLLALNRECGVTLIMVTHDVGIAHFFDRRFHVAHGELSEQRKSESNA